MKKWVDWQEQNQTINKAITEKILFPYNIKDCLNPILEFLNSPISKKYIQETSAFDVEDKYPKKISIEYGLLEEQVKEWTNDPTYEKLMKSSGTMCYLKLPDVVLKKFKILLHGFLPIHLDDATIACHIQKPGQMFPLHYDMYRYNDFILDKNKEDKILRFLVFLTDQHPGQAFLLGENYLKWKAGDVVSWNRISEIHGSANFGYVDRPVLVITGKNLNTVL